MICFRSGPNNKPLVFYADAAPRNDTLSVHEMAAHIDSDAFDALSTTVAQDL